MDLTPLTPDTGKSDRNTSQSMKYMAAQKRKKKQLGYQVSSVILWGLLLSFELPDNEPFTLSCQNLLETVWLQIHVWFSLLFSIKSVGAWL